MECIGCKKEISNDSNFCPNCGLRVKKEQKDFKKVFKDLLKGDKEIELSKELNKLDTEKDSGLIIETSTSAINIFSLKQVPLHFLRAISYIYEEKYDLSLKDLTKIIDTTNDVCSDKFLEDFIQSIEEDYSIIQIATRSYNFRGIIYTTKEKYDLAINDFNEYQNLISDSNIKNMFKEDVLKEDMYLNHYFKGLSYLNKEDINNTKIELEKAIKINPNNDTLNELYEKITKGGSHNQIMNNVKTYGSEFINNFFKELTKPENVNGFVQGFVKGVLESFFEDY